MCGARGRSSVSATGIRLAPVGAIPPSDYHILRASQTAQQRTGTAVAQWMAWRGRRDTRIRAQHQRIAFRYTGRVVLTRRRKGHEIHYSRS